MAVARAGRHLGLSDKHCRAGGALHLKKLPQEIRAAIGWRCLLIHLLSPLRRQVALHLECNKRGEGGTARGSSFRRTLVPGARKGRA